MDELSGISTDKAFEKKKSALLKLIDAAVKEAKQWRWERDVCQLHAWATKVKKKVNATNFEAHATLEAPSFWYFNPHTMRDSSGQAGAPDNCGASYTEGHRD